MKLYSRISLVVAIATLSTMNISASTVSEKISINSLKIKDDSPYRIEFKFNSVWEGGRTGEIVIHNVTNEALVNWELEFELDANINSVWNANMEKISNKYTIEAESYNTIIYPRESVTIGFECEWSDGDVIPEEYILIGDSDVVLDKNDQKDVINNISSPQALNLDIPRAISFATEQDEIWFSFRPDATESYEFICDGDTNLVMTLFDKTKDKVVANNMGSDNTKLLANTLIKSKEYFVKIVPVDFNSTKNEFFLEVKKCPRPNDAFFDKQWALLNGTNGIDINVLPVWRYLHKNTVPVAISDTGTYYQHEDFLNSMNIDMSYNFIHDSKDVFPENEFYGDGATAVYGHGTHVTGIIGAEVDNNIGIAGVIPNSDLISYKVLGRELKNDATYIDSIAAFINSIEVAKENNIRIMNCSFGGAYPSVAEREAMKYAKEILFVIAAGNDGQNLKEIPSYPACYYHENSLVVANINSNGEMSHDSNYGGPTDIGAPGSDIFSTMPYGKYALMSGTSMAAPHVTGVCGLVLSQNPSLSSVDLKYYVTNSDNVTQLQSLKDTTLSGGYLNAYKAVVTPNTKCRPHKISGIRDPFEGNIKNKIRYYKNLAPDDVKTSQLFISINDDTPIDEWIEILNKDYGLKNVEVKEYLESIEAYVLECSSIQDCDEAVEILNSYDRVKYAEPNYYREQ